MNPKNASVSFYLLAREKIFSAGYGHEYEWQLSIVGASFGEREFLREYAWVVLNCGFRESIIRRIFSFISLAFFDFASAREIVAHDEECIEIAFARFRNVKKLRAIVAAAKMLMGVGSLETFHDEIRLDPARLNLPFLGNTTRAHLLKNLGFGMAKNDRHLARLCAVYGFTNAQEMCEHISGFTGEPVGVIDLVLWRFSTLLRGTRAFVNAT